MDICLVLGGSKPLPGWFGVLMQWKLKFNKRAMPKCPGHEFEWGFPNWQLAIGLTSLQYDYLVMLVTVVSILVASCFLLVNGCCLNFPTWLLQFPTLPDIWKGTSMRICKVHIYQNLLDQFNWLDQLSPVSVIHTLKSHRIVSLETRKNLSHNL